MRDRTASAATILTGPLDADTSAGEVNQEVVASAKRATTGARIVADETDRARGLVGRGAGHGGRRGRGQAVLCACIFHVVPGPAIVGKLVVGQLPPALLTAA
jgi:hypothetical protein